MGAVEVLALTFAAVALAMLALWGLSLALRDASIVDIFWGPGFAMVAAISCALGAGAPGRRALATGLAALWGLRLGGYLLARNAGKGEDARYQAMRRHHGDRFARVSLVTVFGLQGVLMWFISLPLQVANLSPEPAELGALDALGAGLVAVGLAFEAIGDWQLARFKRDPASAGRVLDTGLWRYTRHPNYFGDCVVWWGFFTLALATPSGWLTVLSPVVMTVLLTRVSGVPMLERTIGRRRPGYADYVARTSAFVPLPPRRRS
jgi:steroid 5-alpha reductase family enzyme